MAGGYDHVVIEAEARAFWKKISLLSLLSKKNEGGKNYFLLDGPPYANNVPHVGHIRNTVYKDLYLRLAMMRGANVLFQPGFDTHGLPIENMVEKQLGIVSKQEIEKTGILTFTDKCKESAAINKDLWLEVYDILGSWYSWKAPYLTYENSYIQSAWWGFKQIWDKGYVYEGRRPVHWCPHCQTALAGYEVTDSYKMISDPGVYVKFRVRDESETYFLVFTTTPWTLPSNVALVVNGKEEYVYAKTEKGILILAKNLLSFLDRIELSYKILKTVKGHDLDGLRYESLMDLPTQKSIQDNPNALRVFLSIPLLKERVASKVGAKKGIDKKDLFEDFVTVTDGTGIVHCAPGHGHTDNEVGKHYGMPELSPLDEAACFTEEAGKYAGRQVREASRDIATDIETAGDLVHFERIDHNYPLCWRCKTPLIFRLSHQWFIRLDPVREALLEANEQLSWQPDFAKERMHNWIANAGDWNFSRQRYWGIPIPIWRCDCGKMRVIESEEELRRESALAGSTIPEIFDLHTAGMFSIPCECGQVMTKVPDIFDVWYDSGCAFFASLGYPHKNKELFDLHYPISRINESQDQIRGWFYHLLLVGQLVFDKCPLETISMPGWVVDERGDKMSKSVGNVVWAKEGLEEYGADVVRFYYCWDIAPYLLQKFNVTTLTTEVRKMFAIVWNLLSLYEQQREQHVTAKRSTDSVPVEDRWILSRKNTVLRAYFESLNTFEIHEGARQMYEFIIGDVSRTYVQFTRERSEEDPRVCDVLSEILRDVLVALAPITPHVSEMGYQRLRGDGDPISVHLCDLPVVAESDVALEEDFSLLQTCLAGVLAARDKAQISLRWPIGEAVFVGVKHAERIVSEYDELLLRKTNVKRIVSEGLELSWSLAPNVGALGKLLGQETADFLSEFPDISEMIAVAFRANESFSWRTHAVTREHVTITLIAPQGWVCMPCGEGMACVSTARTMELDAEGYAREVTRRIQQLRKSAGLSKGDHIHAVISADELLASAVSSHAETIAEKVGARTFRVVSSVSAEEFADTASETVKGQSYVIGLRRA